MQRVAADANRPRRRGISASRDFTNTPKVGKVSEFLPAITPEAAAKPTGPFSATVHHSCTGLQGKHVAYINWQGSQVHTGEALAS